MRVLMLGVLVMAAACGAKETPTPVKRTAAEQRAVDSTVGASRLPGARGVQGALRASDSAKARAREIDSLSRTP